MSAANPYPHLYILIAADGWTGLCDGTIPALRAEVDRSVPLAPITVHHWMLTENATAHGGWVKQEEFLWP